MNFAEKFCARRQVAPKNFEASVLRLALYPAARLLFPLLNLSPGYFAPDREFIRGVGRISRGEAFRYEEQDFSLDPDNRGLLRRGLKLRVSARRLRRLVHETLGDSGAHG